MKILHVGNPEAFKNFAICSYFKSKGYEIHYFSPMPVQKRQEGIVYHFNPENDNGKLGIIKNIILLRRVIKKVKPDILHAHNVRTYGWMASLSGFSPFLLHAYGSDVLPKETEKLRPYQFWLSKNAVKKSDWLVVTGKHMVEAVAENFDILENKIKVIPRGVKLEIFKPANDKEKKDLRKKYRISEDAFVLLSPRYLFDSIYNIDIILKAISKITKKYKNIILIQMHNHNSNQLCFIETMNLIKKLCIKNHVMLIKMVPNYQMAEILNISDICISVPSSDGFPVSILEASACKIPMIVSRLPYASEWFENEKNGLIVEERDPDGLSAAIAELIQNPEKRNRFAEYNFNKVRQEADYEKCMSILEGLYHGVSLK